MSKNIKTYHYEIACKSQEDFDMAIKVAKENAQEEENERIKNYLLNELLDLKYPDGSYSQAVRTVIDNLSNTTN